MKRSSLPLIVCLAVVQADAQLIDRTKAPNVSGDGIAKSLAQQIGAGRGNLTTPDSSTYIIRRDPFRAIRRGRQLFQRKFSVREGLGPLASDGSGDINTKLEIGAGLADSCASCHGRPRGSAGFGGDVATRPDSRDAPHLFGLGLKEMLADEMTSELRATRTRALLEARVAGRNVTRTLEAKDVAFGQITAKPDGTLDTSRVDGVDADLRVRPFFAHGGTVSIREFVVGALKNEMGLQAVDAELMAAAGGGRMVTMGGMVLDGALDKIEAPATADAAADPDGDGVRHEVPIALVDYVEFYLLNYFKAARLDATPQSRIGRRTFERIGCARCHVTDLHVDRDRRVADVETEEDPRQGIFNRLFATAAALFRTEVSAGGPDLKLPKLGRFAVRDIFTDFKRHDLGPNFHERNYDGTIRKEFLTTPLWGVATTAPYGHDGRSINLTEVILRHGGEAQRSRDGFSYLSGPEQGFLLEFLQTLVLFPPDDTASNLDAGDRRDPLFPQKGHGSIRLTTLFNNPADPE